MSDMPFYYDRLFVRYADAAQRLLDSDLSWKVKHEMIFREGQRISLVTTIRVQWKQPALYTDDMLPSDSLTQAQLVRFWEAEARAYVEGLQRTAAPIRAALAAIDTPHLTVELTTQLKDDAQKVAALIGKWT